MPNPKMTGISNITGKTVYVRHATSGDMFIMGKSLKLAETSFDGIASDNVVVAMEEDRLIAFAILKQPVPAPGEMTAAGCVTLFEDNRRRGIGALVVAHLMEYAPVKTVYTAVDRPEYFKLAGFRKAASVPVKSLESAAGRCRLPGKRGAVVKKYERIARNRSKAA